MHSDRLQLDSRFPLVEVMAWRPHVAVAALTGAAVLAGQRRYRPAAALLGATGLSRLAALTSRAIPARPVPRTDDDLVILNLNVLRGAADTGQLATAIGREAPDFVVLPESGHAFRDKLMPLVDGLGYRSWVSVGPDVRESRGMTLLASAARRRPARRDRGRHAVPAPARHRRHPRPPEPLRGPRHRPARPGADRRMARGPRGGVAMVSRPGGADRRRRPQRHTRPLRPSSHPARMPERRDGHGSQGSPRPTRRRCPRALGIQIDHVFVPSGTTTSRFEVMDVAGSDHRAVLAQVRLPVL